MEQKSNKKFLTILCITLIVILFCLGITFSLVSSFKRNEAAYYNSNKSLIDNYNKNLSK